MQALLLKQELCGHSGIVWKVAWSNSGDLLASCSGDRSVRIWKQIGDSWVCVSILEDSHTRTIRSIAWSPDDRRLASASFDGTTAIWRRRTTTGVEDLWEQVAVLEGHENEVKDVAWNGQFLATCGRDKTVWIWECLECDEFECVDVQQGHSQDVKSVLFYPHILYENAALFSASYDDTIKMWRQDAQGDWFCQQTLDGASGGHMSTVWALAFQKHQKQSIQIDSDENDRFNKSLKMVSCSDDKTLKLWGQKWNNKNQFKMSLQCTLSGYCDRPIFSVDWSENDKIAIGCGDNSIQIFQQIDDIHEKIQFEQIVKVENAHSQDINCVAWRTKGDNTILASASDDGTIKIWEIKKKCVD
eukprot:TRINITY_DN25416_c2_g1_i1.p1 TRINITY_DN25416_c2_g1~~TRINITY_DN25416_c2_g1_i1.p1  ORF type:complete len:358 (-),score=43.94 TRINITY_DN25416_c2_g1_i1:132-1205(-)